MYVPIDGCKLVLFLAVNWLNAIRCELTFPALSLSFGNAISRIVLPVTNRKWCPWLIVGELSRNIRFSFHLVIVISHDFNVLLVWGFSRVLPVSKSCDDHLIKAAKEHNKVFSHNVAGNSIPHFLEVTLRRIITTAVVPFLQNWCQRNTQSKLNTIWSFSWPNRLL